MIDADRRRHLLAGAAAAGLGVRALAQPAADARPPAAPPMLRPREVLHLRVAVPAVLHGLAGAVRIARMTAVMPRRFDARRHAPVLVVSATSDPAHASSRRLMETYQAAAAEAGWVALAADPDEPVEQQADTLSMRFALVRTALAALGPRWPGGASPPLGFAGFSGGAKYAGWLAALYAQQREPIAGLYLSGVNEEVVLDAAQRLQVLDDAYRAVPVLLQAGRDDDVAPPERHRVVLAALNDAGFRAVRLELVDGPHAPDATALPAALAWFAAQWRERQGRDLIEA